MKFKFKENDFRFTVKRNKILVATSSELQNLIKLFVNLRISEFSFWVEKIYFKKLLKFNQS